MSATTEPNDTPGLDDVRRHADIDLDAAAQLRTIDYVRRTIDQATANATPRPGTTRKSLARVGRRTPALVGGVALAVVAVLTISAASDHKPGTPVRPVGEGIPTGPPSRSFALLREPSKVPMPRQVQRLLANVGAPVSSAKSLDLGFDRPGWALSSTEKVCIVVPDTLNGKFAGYGSSCAPRERAQTSGVADWRQHSDNPSVLDPQEIFALIPDGVAAVTVTNERGQTRQINVEGNVLRVDAQIGDRVSFKDNNGRLRNLAANDDTPSED